MMHLTETNLKNWVQGKRLSWYEKINWCIFSNFSKMNTCHSQFQFRSQHFTRTIIHDSTHKLLSFCSYYSLSKTIRPFILTMSKILQTNLSHIHPSPNQTQYAKKRWKVNLKYKKYSFCTFSNMSLVSV